MSALRVLISGASIAGPTAAYWFARAGATVTVVERFPALRTNGSGIDIRTAGVTVMRRMEGMEAAVRARFTQMEGICFLDTHGRAFATMRATGDPDAQSLVSEFEIFRGDLARILYDLTSTDERIRYVFGEQIASIAPSSSSSASPATAEGDDGPVTVTFANGSLPPSEYDLVIAADGASSRTRAMGLQCGLSDHVVRLGVWVAYFSTPANFLSVDPKLGHGYSEAPGRFVAVGPDPFTGRNRVSIMGIAAQPDDARMQAFREANARGEAALKEHIAGEFGGMGWRCADLINEMRRSDDLYASEWVQVKLPHLSKGRFALIGDAGCAPGPTGNGTSLALASAYVLAGEMARAKGDVRAGLRAYEERMAPIVRDMQKIPPGVPGVMAPQTWWGHAVRNTVFWGVSWAMRLGQYLPRMGGLWASSFGADKYGLPQYEWTSEKATSLGRGGPSG